MQSTHVGTQVLYSSIWNVFVYAPCPPDRPLDRPLDRPPWQCVEVVFTDTTYNMTDKPKSKLREG